MLGSIRLGWRRLISTATGGRQDGNGGGTNTSQATFGGSIYNRVGFLILDGVQMQNNRANDGGAVFGSDTVVIINSTLINNFATSRGGAVALFNQRQNNKILDVTNTTFSGNGTTNGGGKGGAIYVFSSNTNCVLRSVTITGNLISLSGCRTQAAFQVSKITRF